MQMDRFGFLFFGPGNPDLISSRRNLQKSGICRKCYLFDNVQFLGNGTGLVKNYFKTKLGYPNLTKP